MDFYEVDLAQVGYGFPPQVPVVLRDKVGDVYALRGLAILLLMPVQLLDLQLQLVDDFGFFVGKANCEWFATYSTEKSSVRNA